MTYLTYIERNPEMNDIPADLTCNQEELEKWLDSSPPLSDDEMKAMSAYFESEIQFTNNSFLI